MNLIRSFLVEQEKSNLVALIAVEIGEYRKKYDKFYNFKVTGKSGGNSHGNGKRKDSGNYIPHKDFRNIKTRFLYRFDGSKEIENT